MEEQRKSFSSSAVTSTAPAPLPAAGLSVKHLGFLKEARKSSLSLKDWSQDYGVSPKHTSSNTFPYVTITLMGARSRGPFNSNTQAQASEVHDKLKAFQDMAWWCYLRSC